MQTAPTPDPFCRRDLSGARVLVTGASRGIGRAISTAFARHSTHLYILARSLDALEVTKGLCLSLGAQSVTIIQADLGDTDPTRTQAMLDMVVSTIGDTLDIMVHNAGRGTRESAADITPAAFDAVHAVNLRAPQILTAALLPTFLSTQERHGRGSIVFVGSVLGVHGRARSALYCSTKHGLEGYVDSLWQELQPTGSHVSIIRPSYVATDMTSGNQAGIRPEDMIHPDDIASAVLFVSTFSNRGCPRIVQVQCQNVEGS
ncbi:short-chain dehydrogenase/reductase SDR [Kipferlia bialata]|uniref:Short-chain dehydrogenase/reductase SDR n=1 Tax=Kipferlia bialata TaxID=797122 RepID=A0A9K3GHE3_9EUKA|nr:short-chain dehydrogenase/reductase SDR [Kipferlia bialata]|eukprot:g3945.t1